MRIGYQGAVGSNSEQAAHDMSDELGFADVEYVPLISSQGVISALVDGDIDYGVVAVRNSIGGMVVETAEAIRDVYLEIVCETTIDIHHCLYKHPDAQTDELRYVASHIQALKQTERTCGKRYPQLEPMEIEDTAIGAEWLASGKLGKDVAIICRDTAGERNGLELIEANIEDVSDNRTEFMMVRLLAVA